MNSTASARQRLVSHFVRAGATSPGNAIAFDAYDTETLRLFRRLRRYRAIEEAGPGQYWLDPARLERFRRSVRVRAAAWMATSGLLATAMAAATAFAVAE